MKAKVAQFLCLAAMVIGIVLTIKSVDIGGNYVNSIVRQQGGSMDTATYLIYLQEYIKTYRDLGLALLVIGGLGEISVLRHFGGKS